MDVMKRAIINKNKKKRIRRPYAPCPCNDRRKKKVRRN